MNGTWKDIDKLERDLWEAADNLRANSKLTSNDYFMPVLGVIFLRHAANRFDVAGKQIADDQAAGRMPRRTVIKEDFVRRRSLWLPEEAQYDWIMEQAATRESDLPALVTGAMQSIEASFEPLQGVLPKDYGIFEPKVLDVNIDHLFSALRKGVERFGDELNRDDELGRRVGERVHSSYFSKLTRLGDM